MKIKNINRLETVINGYQYIISIQRNDDEDAIDYYLIKKDKDNIKLKRTYNIMEIIINQELIQILPATDEFNGLIKLLHETPIDKFEIIDTPTRFSKKHTI